MNLALTHTSGAALRRDLDETDLVSLTTAVTEDERGAERDTNRDEDEDESTAASNLSATAIAARLDQKLQILRAPSMEDAADSHSGMLSDNCALAQLHS